TRSMARYARGLPDEAPALVHHRAPHGAEHRRSVAELLEPRQARPTGPKLAITDVGGFDVLARAPHAGEGPDVRDLIDARVVQLEQQVAGPHASLLGEPSRLHLGQLDTPLLPDRPGGDAAPQVGRMPRSPNAGAHVGDQIG